jgi:hypothetical protein
MMKVPPPKFSTVIEQYPMMLVEFEKPRNWNEVERGRSQRVATSEMAKFEMIAKLNGKEKVTKKKFFFLKLFSPVRKSSYFQIGTLLFC